MTDEDTEFWYGLVFGFGVLVLITVLVVVLLHQGSTFARARIARRELAQDRELLDRYESLADRSAEQQKVTSTELTTIRERLDSIEAMLREVE
jgi:hypothetical protein